MLKAEHDMRSAAAAAEAAAGELNRLIGENGLLSQIEDQSQRSTVLAATARRRAEHYEAVRLEFSTALAAAGLPLDWTPERVQVPVEQRMNM